MTSLVQRVSKRSMNFTNQRKAYMLREVQGMAYEDIAAKVVNLSGEHPCWSHVRDVCTNFSVKKGCKPYMFQELKCMEQFETTSLRSKFIIPYLHHVCSCSTPTLISHRQNFARPRPRGHSGGESSRIYIRGATPKNTLWRDESFIKITACHARVIIVTTHSRRTGPGGQLPKACCGVRPFFKITGCHHRGSKA